MEKVFRLSVQNLFSGRSTVLGLFSTHKKAYDAYQIWVEANEMISTYWLPEIKEITLDVLDTNT